MTFQGTILWGSSDAAVVDSPNAFYDLIRQLDAEVKVRPVMVDIIAGDGRSLALGLGRTQTVLSLTGPQGSPPYYASLGDGNVEGSISFDYHGESTDFQLRHAVPNSVARTAAVQFMSGLGLPKAVRWEEI
jgi:hypothetical protein